MAQPRGRRLDLGQHAVDAIAHAQPRFGGFEMDVRGAHLHRARDQAVDQPDHRRLAGEILQPFEIGVAVVVVAFARRLVDALDGGAAVAIEPLASRLDVGGKGGAAQHRLVEGEGERARGAVVERIGHRDDQRRLALGDRQNPRLPQEAAADAPGGDRLGGELRRRQHRRADDRGVRVGEVALGHEAELGRDVVDPLAAFRLQPPHAIEGRTAEQSARREHGLDPGGRERGQAIGHGRGVQFDSGQSAAPGSFG